MIKTVISQHERTLHTIHTLYKVVHEVEKHLRNPIKVNMWEPKGEEQRKDPPPRMTDGPTGAVRTDKSQKYA